MNLNKLLDLNTQREITKHLWRYNDKVIATNGFAMFVINADLVDLTGIDLLTDISVVSEILSYEYVTNKKINLQDFKEWLGPPEYIKECACKNVLQKCTECNGKGTVECNMGEEHDCPECDGGADYYCDKCDDGWIKPKRRYVGLFEVVVNGNVLSQYLEEVHDIDVIMSCSGDNPVRFSGDGWDVYIMPVKDAMEVRKYG